jgi:hypothetical protein
VQAVVDGHADDADRLKWWQKYIPSYFLYQNKPLSAFVVSIPTPHEVGGWYANYVQWDGTVPYPGEYRSLQVRGVTGTDLNDFVPPWLSFSNYELTPTIVPKIYHPQDRYTFEMTFGSGSTPVLVKLNMFKGGSVSMARKPRIKELMQDQEAVYHDFLEDWCEAILRHKRTDDSEEYGILNLRMREAQRRAVVRTTEQILAEHASLDNSPSYINDFAEAVREHINNTVSNAIDYALNATAVLYEHVVREYDATGLGGAGSWFDDGATGCNDPTCTDPDCTNPNHILNYDYTEGTPEFYEIVLHRLILQRIATSMDTFDDALRAYVAEALQHDTHGFYALYVRNLRIEARDLFLDSPQIFQPHWEKSPFFNLKINGVPKTETFLERFKEKLLQELNAPINDFVANFNNSTQSTSVGEITDMIKNWYNSVFTASVQWHAAEPQKHIVERAVRP